MPAYQFDQFLPDIDASCRIAPCAKALGLTVPLTLFALAVEVIDEFCCGESVVGPLRHLLRLRKGRSVSGQCEHHR
jgi:hypothetical protein